MATMAKSTKRPAVKHAAVKAPAKSKAKVARKAAHNVLAKVEVRPAPRPIVRVGLTAVAKPAMKPAHGGYVLENQIGFRLRKAHQRATVLFHDTLAQFDVTPTQFAALAKLHDLGSVSQNQLGRLTAMDPATILGVIGRLVRQGHVRTRPDPLDARLSLLELTPEGVTAVVQMKALAEKVTTRTLSPLKEDEANLLVRLLAKIG